MTRQEAIPKLTQKPFQPKDEFRLLKFVQMLLSETYYYLVRGRLPSGTRDEVSDIRRETFELYVTIRTGVYDLYEYKFYEMEIDPMQLRKMKQACKDKAYSTHSAVDYLIKTDARSEKIESAVLMLYDQGVKAKDFKRLIAERGLK